MADTGRGAWTSIGKDNGSIYYSFKKKTPLDGSTPEKGEAYLCVRGGVAAIQDRLISLGYDQDLKKPFNAENYGVFNRQTRKMVLEFQKDTLPESYHSGLVGSTTAKHLFGPYLREINPKHAHFLFGIASTESGFDPGAQGWFTPGDIGLYQINTLVHTDFDIPRAIDYVESTEWVSARFEKYWKKYSGKGIGLRTDCSIAQHNAPAWADSWFKTGEPPNEKIADYVDNVKMFATQFASV